MTNLSPTPVSKPALQSLTIWGVITTAVGYFAPQLAGWLHVQPGDIGNALSAAATIAGLVMSVIGRFKASQPLH